jgi:hypothetical protein
MTGCLVHRGPAWHARRVPRTRLGVTTRRLALIAASLTVAGCGLGSASPPLSSSPGSPTAAQSLVEPSIARTGGSPSGSAPVASPAPVASTVEPETDDVEADAEPVTVAAGSGPTAADVAAGLTSLTVVPTGTGHLVVVPGNVPAPGKGRIITVRVEVESGIGVDGDRFAAFVMATLNDSRGWGHSGTLRFARTAGTAQVRVVLASPTTSARLCRPLQTFGKLSCRTGNSAVLTAYRWVKAIREYRTDRTGYRHYVISHEVGHALGHGHLMCAGKGAVAPVMMQQTKGLKGCLPNPWPYPTRARTPTA